jgi:tight adherence protein B
MATELPTLRIESRSDYAGILRDDQGFGTGVGATAEDRVNNGFDQLMVQSGMRLAPAVFLLLMLLCGVALGGILFVWQEDLLITAIGVALGFMVPLAVAYALRARRQQKLLVQMPDMVDELARAARTGRSIEQCLTMVAHDTPLPLREEMGLITSRLALGSSLKHALSGIPERTGLVSMKILAMALTVHQQTGGDITSVLDRLSRTMRERMQYLGRLRAATAASRATAILMLVLPPGILAFFLVRDPEYLTRLFSSGWGRTITIIAIVLDLIGVVWTLRILNTSQRT